MRAAARVRGLPGVVAGLVLAIASAAHALTVSGVSISPGTVVPLGTVITLSATLINDFGTFGALCANPQLSTAGCGNGGVCAAPEGLYAVSASDPQILTNPVALAPTLPFTHTLGEPVVATWTFTATRTGTVGFSVMAYDAYGYGEGCGDPSPAGDCPPSNSGLFTPDAFSCGFMFVTVTSTLTGRANASVIAPTPRPANTAYPGDTIAVVMSVTNTGPTPLTLNAGLSATRAGSTAQLIPAGAPAFPAGLAAGNAAFLTWTWSVAGVPQPGTTATFATDVERTLAVSNILTVAAPPLTVTATLLIDPDGAGATYAAAAGGVTYYIINDEIQVCATVANLGGSSIDVDPVIVLPDTNANDITDVIPSAARTPAGVQILGSLTSRVFVWKYRINREDYYQHCLSSPPLMQFFVRTRGLTVEKRLDVHSDAVSLAGGAPATVTVGYPFSVTLWVTNQTGRAMELDASATVFLVSNDPAKAAVLSGPPPGSRVFAPGESQPYVFTVNALTEGSAPLRGGLLFPDIAPCFLTPSQFYVEIVPPSPLDISITPSATVVNAGTPYLLTILVTNSTSCPAELADLHEVKEYPRQAPSLVTLDLYSTDCPTFPCSVAPASTVLFTATVTSPECGDADWSGTETGQWGAACGSAPFGKPFSSPVIRIRKAAALAEQGSVTWAVSKNAVVEGQTFDVTATVIPAGENDLTGFSLSPVIHVSSMSTTVSVISIPSVPGTLAGCGACVTNICPGKAQSFTWTVKALAKGAGTGRVWFTFTATGQDPYDASVSISSTTTGQVQIQRPSILSIGGIVPGEGTVFVAAISPGGELDGCQIPVVACFNVDGDTDVSTTTFLPGAGMTPSPAGRAVLSGSPDIPALLTPGEHCFTWTFSPMGTGTVNFTASGVGREVTFWSTLFVQASTVGGAFLTPAGLSAVVAVSTTHVTTAAGQFIIVTANVTNPGDVPVTSLSASATVTGSVCGARPVQDPRLGARIIPGAFPLAGCGDDQVFQWTFTATSGSAGVIMFSVTISGLDLQTSAPLTATVMTVCVLIRQPLLVGFVPATPTIETGSDLDVMVRLRNPGATPLNVVPGIQVLVSGSPDVIVLPPPPPGPVTVAAGQTVDVPVRMSARGAATLGPVVLSFAATPFTASDPDLGGAAVPAVPSGTLIIRVVPPVQPGITISDNPWHPLSGAKLRLTWGEPAGGEVSLRVLNLNGETVRTLLTGTAPGTSGVVEWDGTNTAGQTLAAGVYLLRWESAGKKQTRKLAVVK